MSSAWLLPEHIADVLPAQARRIEELRRTLLDLARSYGFELVMPPLLEYLESLLSGTGRELDLQTFKLVDQLSGRSLGLRADTTPQVARIDAHLLNRSGVSRLCYCGPVLHTRPARPHATREPLQFGAEVYGHAGPEADLEILQLAIDSLSAAKVSGLHLDLADARIVASLLAGQNLSDDARHEIHAALAVKDAASLARLTTGLPADHLTWHGGNPIGYIATWYVIALATLVEPAFYQRCYAAKNASIARNGILVSIGCWAVFDFLTTTCGLYARAILPDLADPVSSYPALALEVLPAGLLGLFALALLSTVMSTVDSYSFVAASTFGKDIMQRSG